MPRQRLGPIPRQRDLTHRGGALAVLKRKLARSQLEHRAAERDGSRGYHQNVAFLRMQRGDVGGQRRQPFFVEPAALGIDQQRGADLDDDPPEIASRGVLMAGCMADFMPGFYRMARKSGCRFPACLTSMAWSGKVDTGFSKRSCSKKMPKRNGDSTKIISL